MMISLFCSVCTKWKEASEGVWSSVKKLEYKTEWPECKDPKNGVPCYCFEPLCNLKLKFYHIPNLFVLCGHYVRELDITKLNNSVILAALKGHFPNLVKLSFLMYEWKEEHIRNLFTGMTKLEFLDSRWHYSKVVPLTFFNALNDVDDTLKELRIKNQQLHANPSGIFNTYHFEDACLPVCINSN